MKGRTNGIAIIANSAGVVLISGVMFSAFAPFYELRRPTLERAIRAHTGPCSRGYWASAVLVNGWALTPDVQRSVDSSVVEMTFSI